MKILFLSRWFPWPKSNGSKVRIYNLLAGLAQHHTITLLSFADEGDAVVAPPELTQFCEIHPTIPWKPFTPASWRARCALLRLTPRSIVATNSPAMAQAITDLLARQTFDLVIASQLGAATYAPYFAGAPALFEEVELGLLSEQYRQAQTVGKRLQHGLTWFKHRRYVGQLLHHFRACTVVSEGERRLVRKAAPDFPMIEVMPNCVNLADYAQIQPLPQANSLIFTGAFRYPVNYEAMCWFLQQVFPQVYARRSDVQLTITGDHGQQPLPWSENVKLTGFVPDVRPWIAGATCSIAPLLHGGGTRVKILEAMALGTPVISTSKGAEGIEAAHDVHLLIADSPQAFAEAILRLLDDHHLRQRLADNAYQLVRAKYDWAATLLRFLHLIERVATPPVVDVAPSRSR